jgi:hypothetical protein
MRIVSEQEIGPSFHYSAEPLRRIPRRVSDCGRIISPSAMSKFSML